MRFDTCEAGCGIRVCRLELVVKWLLCKCYLYKVIIAAKGSNKDLCPKLKKVLFSRILDVVIFLLLPDLVGL